MTPGPNIICSRPMSHLAPSLTKTSSGLMRPLYSLSEILARMSAFELFFCKDRSGVAGRGHEREQWDGTG